MRPLLCACAENHAAQKLLEQAVQDEAQCVIDRVLTRTALDGDILIERSVFAHNGGDGLSHDIYIWPGKMALPRGFEPRFKP